MTSDSDNRRSVFRRPVTRRAVVGGSLAAGSVAIAYAALGDKLNPFGSSASPSQQASQADTDAISKESVKISHLLRRAGFGASQEEHAHYQSLGLKGAIDELVSFTTINDDEALNLASKLEITAANRAAPVAWWLTRIANTKRPLQEKMTFFWHNLLTSQTSVVRDPTAMVAQNEFFRAHAFDTFPNILRGISMDPAMMTYLDVDGSQRTAPNENYARELMELFSLGVGNYTEQDVREGARAFTGWQIPRDRVGNDVVLKTPLFRPARFDSGTKNFLGKSGSFRPDDIVNIITDQPASATYITKRLFSFFIYPNPSDTDLKPFVDVYNKNDRNIGVVVEAMLRSDVFYSPRAYRALVKSPVEYATGVYKALDLSPTLGNGGAAGAARAAPNNVLGDMGQTLFEPPNVAGWPGGAAWLNSATMFARLNFVNQVTNVGGQAARGANARAAATPTPAPVASDLGTTAQALDHYLPLTLDGNLSAETRQVLVDFAGGNETQLTAEQLRGLVYLILGSPQFQLA